MLGHDNVKDADNCVQGATSAIFPEVRLQPDQFVFYNHDISKKLKSFCFRLLSCHKEFTVTICKIIPPRTVNYSSRLTVT
jgi:hypothetical protein